MFLIFKYFNYFYFMNKRFMANNRKKIIFEADLSKNKKNILFLLDHR